jgi:hypothetical protein
MIHDLKLRFNMTNNGLTKGEDMSTKLSQKEAVFQAVCNVTGHTGEGTVVISKEQRGQVNAILFEGFKSGSIECEREYTDSDLKGYVSGLQSNWLRKDKRLNGGTQYVAKNPGSRAGATDPSLKAMKALLSTMTGDEYTDADRAEVQGHIDAKIAEINMAKQAKSVDFSALPADLAAKFAK